MKTISFFRVSNIKQAIEFYTRVLDFTLKYPTAQPDEIFVDLVNGDAELGLTSLPGDQKAAINVYVEVEDVDELFRKYISRGLVVPQHSHRCIQARLIKHGGDVSSMLPMPMAIR